MDFLRLWITGIAGAAIFGVLVMAVVPKGSARRVLRVGMALLLSMAVLRPLTGIRGEFSLETALGAYRDETAKKPGQDFLSGIIAEQARAYIESKADEAGLSVAAAAECRTGEAYPELYSVTVRARRPEHARNVLSKIIEEDLGIPKERQRYTK